MSSRTPGGRVVVVGEALMDVQGTRSQVGGAPVNVAVGLARMGVPTAWFGPVGSDADGARVRRHLAQAGADLDLVVEVDAPTSRAVISVDESGHPTYAFELAGTSCRSATLGAGGLAGAALAIVVGGAIGFEDAPLGTSMAALVESCDRPIWLDPNVRPSALAGGAYGHTVERLVGASALVKVSIEDLEQLVPGRDPWDVAAAWAVSGPGLVVVSDGAAGLVALRPDGTHVEVPAVPVDVNDTVGAGDTVTAALATWSHQRGCFSRQELRALDDTAVSAALTFATIAAAITCSRAGADPPTMADMKDPPPTS